MFRRALLLVSAGPWLAACSTPAPKSTAVPAAAAKNVLERIPAGECRGRLAQSLAAGVRTADDCGQARRFAQRRLVREVRDAAFGVVELVRVDLSELRWVVSVADRCRLWPLREVTRTRLTVRDASHAGCRLRRHGGPMVIRVVNSMGYRHEVLRTESDSDGRLRIRFADLDSALRSQGEPALAHWSRIEVGEDAWAGVVDLVELHQLLASWHFRWVVRGRGSPGLFVALHPEHEGAGIGRALAVEATLARQEDDYLAVSRGQLEPRRFLQRHAWSPYRRSVAAMENPSSVSRESTPTRPTWFEPLR